MAVETSGGDSWAPLRAPQDVVLESNDVENFLCDVTDEFIRDIKGARRDINWAATLFSRGEAHTLAAGSAQALAADREQCSFADGPVLQAVRSGDFVHVPDLARERRWPGYAIAAASHGVGSLLSMPIAAAAVSSAAINLYAPNPHAFTSDDIIRTRSYARHVARSLRVVLRVAERAEANAELAVAQTSMALMDLAVRTLMSDYGLSHEGAFQYLRTVARHNNLGLRDVALGVVSSGSRRDQAGYVQDNTDFRGLIAMDSPPPGVPPQRTASPPETVPPRRSVSPRRSRSRA
ncbi:GAF and ANTAR domain-containing protein [Arthrobacter sp. ISL-48]|uniref:GAF and ANTAR domain-containing protein n=1 Tax=Arthrobacter sp. ISL-48 TaxID=2819110 RepID=UPI001BE75396|nr:GAF and ANTAR domain-containing protein [Arthrobacter sp. ISL-48]MBT2534067.1 GAF and ANTAR domain-containing protein [Arthrobacter sp. ISL-48]